MIELRWRTWRFTFRAGIALLALGGTIAMVLLGNWQTRRAEEKLARQMRVDALARRPALTLPATPVVGADYAYSRVTVRGEFLDKHTMFIDNRVLRGRPGYDVVTPFRIQRSNTCVLVNRGWVGIGPTREAFPQIRTPKGELVIEGLAVVPPERVYELGREADSGPLMQHLVLARIAERTGLKLQPIVLQQTSDTPDGLARVWDRPDLGVSTHRAYAFQWYAMAVVVVILYFALNLRHQVGGSDGDVLG